MKKIFSIILLWSICSWAAAAPQVLVSIVAKVNDQIITSQDLDVRARIIEQQLKAQQIALPAHDQFLHRVLDTLINETLELQLAQRANITVSDSELNDAINRLASDHHVSRQAFEKQLASQDMSYEEFATNMRNQLIIQKLQQQMVVSQITVNPDEVDAYLRSASKGPQTQYFYHLEDILVGLSDAPTPAELQTAKEKAQDIVMQARTGTDFRTLAVAESSGQQALQGGDLGWRSLAELPDVFAQQVANMKVGDVIGPIHTPNGYHVLHLLGVRHNTTTPSTQSTRNQLTDMLFHQKVEEKLQTWISQLRAQAYVKVMLPS